MKQLCNIFFLLTAVQEFFLFHSCCMQFLSSNKRFQDIFFSKSPIPAPPQELNGRPLIRRSTKCDNFIFHAKKWNKVKYLIKNWRGTILFTTVFVDTRLWKTKHSCVLLTDRIEIHQLQPLVWPTNLLYVMLLDCDWWISIHHIETQNSAFLFMSN